MSVDEDPEFEAAQEQLFRTAGEEARRIVTLLKMAEAQGLDDDAHIRGAVREVCSQHAEPRQTWALVEVFARAVADTFADLDEWSAHVVTALAQEDDL